MSKHTKGPWKIAFEFVMGGSQKRSIEQESTDNRIAVLDLFVSEAGCTYEETTEANAKLIAAAPDLFAALIGLIEIGKRDLTNPKYDGYFIAAKAAIAKAEGNE